MKSPAQLARMTNILVVKKYGCATGLNGQFQLGCDCRRTGPWDQLQGHTDHLNSSWLDDNLPDEIGIASLPDRDFVLSRQEHDLFVVLKLLHVAHVLAINPDTRIPINTLGTFEPDFAHHLAVLTSEVRNREQDANLTEKDSRRIKPQAVMHFAPLFLGGSL